MPRGEEVKKMNIPFSPIAGYLLLAAAVLAGEPAQDGNELLARARQAWEAGDALEGKVRAALAGGEGDYAKLLEQQDAAYEKARQAFREALKLAPKNPRPAAEFGRFLSARRELIQARTFFEVALDRSEEAEKKKDSGALLPAEESDIHRALGGLLERAGEESGALEHYRKALALDPGNPRNRISLAVALCAGGAPQGAVVLLRPWADKAGAGGAGGTPAPQMLALGLYTLAVAQEEIGQFEDALALYRRAQELAGQAQGGDRAGVAGRAVLAVARLEDFFDGLHARAPQREKENEERLKKKLAPLPDELDSLARASALCEQGCKLKNSALGDDGFLKALADARAGGAAEIAALRKHPCHDALEAALRAFQEAIVKAPRLARAYYE
ncbi:MAG: tetratricopeptide repeat protein, partial [Planctomycetota bacterium]